MTRRVPTPSVPYRLLDSARIAEHSRRRRMFDSGGDDPNELFWGPSVSDPCGDDRGASA